MEYSTQSNVDLISTAGSESDKINVKISHRIIQLFSEGLYSSPNKALEELVSNSYDAGAKNVHVILSPSLHDLNATIAVIDDGEGMDVEGLKNHWIIGESKRRRGKSTFGRKPIGQFGIGKLSTYVLATKLTHVCKSNGVYYAATMDYNRLEGSADDETKGVFDEQNIDIPLRLLTEDEAKKALLRWTTGNAQGYKAIQLFGEKAPASWTVAIMSNLKELGKKVSPGRLEWVLKTAMPRLNDFCLFLDGLLITPPDMEPPLEKFVIGKDVTQMAKPCPEGLVEREDQNEAEDSIHRYGVYHDELLGRITGFIEVYKDDIDRGKSKFEQSSGFFVYVRKRRVNVDDPGFGIERNLLRHGTFSRFRMVVHIDNLNSVLRSSRESFQQGEIYNTVQDFLRAGFNLARNKLVEYDRSQSPAARISASLSSAPGSLTRKPLLALAKLVADKKVTPFYLRYPMSLNSEEQISFLKDLNIKYDGEDGILKSVEICALDSKEGLATFDIAKGVLNINSSHQFVSAFQDEFANIKRNAPLEMLVMAEVLMEAHLYIMGIDESIIRDAIARRDELLRQFVRTSANRTAGMVAMALIDSRDEPDKLEEEFRAAFEVMGFGNVIRIGGKGEPDGTAEAYLAASEDGTVQRYKVGLEAKSGGKVSASRLGVSGIGRHMRKHACDHHLVIGNSFATSNEEDSATVQEIKQYKKDHGKTITLMHIDDLARLIRIVSSKRIGGLNRIRDLFRKCVTPEECMNWIDELTEETPENWPYREILETVWFLAQEQPNEAVEYAAIIAELRHRNPPIRMTKMDLQECCKAMQVLARDVVFARNNTVEIERRPDLIMDDIRIAIGQYPENERSNIHL